MRTTFRLIPGLLLIAYLAGCGGPQGPLAALPGLDPPGEEPELFAPGLVTTGLTQRDAAVAPDGRAIVFSTAWGAFAGLALTRFERGRWLPPELLPFSTDPDYFHMEPAWSPDGRRLYFLSNRPVDEAQRAAFRPGTWDHQTIWFSERTGEGWSEPRPIGLPVDGPDYEYFPSLARDGTLLFTRQVRGGNPSLWLARPAPGGGFSEPVAVDAEWNRAGTPYNACLHPDGDRIILCLSAEGSIGPADYWVSFRRPDGSWSPKVDLGERINRPAVAAMSASFTPDGRYLLFVSRRLGLKEAPPPGLLTLRSMDACFTSPENGASSVWWVEAAFLEGLRP